MRRSFYNPFIVRKLWRSTSKMMRLPPAFGWVYINSLEYSSDLHRALSRTETPLASRFVHSVTYSYGDYGVRSGVLVDQWFVSAITIQLNVYGKKDENLREKDGNLEGNHIVIFSKSIEEHWSGLSPGEVFPHYKLLLCFICPQSYYSCEP